VGFLFQQSRKAFQDLGGTVAAHPPGNKGQFLNTGLFQAVHDQMDESVRPVAELGDGIPQKKDLLPGFDRNLFRTGTYKRNGTKQQGKQHHFLKHGKNLSVIIFYQEQHNTILCREITPFLRQKSNPWIAGKRFLRSDQGFLG
jgi:hypothetical protein